MKGTNVLKLNQSTMQEALQLWFDKMFVGTAKAKVTLVSCQGNYTDDGFEITVVTEEQALPKAA